MKKLILFLVLSFTGIQNLYSAQYYMSESEGSNANACTFALPCQRVVGKLDGLNALSAGDKVYFKAGDTWTGTNAVVAVNSSGSAGNPIVFDRYGSGADPIFNGSTLTATWTLHSGSIYKKTGQITTTYTIGIDGDHSLSRSDVSNTALRAGEFLNESGTVYIRLFDSSDPSGHSVYVPTFTTAATNFAGLIRGVSGKGAYLEFNNMDVRYSPGYGFEINGTENRVNDCTVIGSGRDGILTQLNGTNFRVYRTEVKYNSSNGNGYGQAVTFNTSGGWAINCNIHDNFMEGIDFLDWSTTGLSNPTQCGAIYNTVKDNGRWLGSSGTQSAHGIYVDGGDNIFIYGNEISGNGNTTGKASTADAGGILIGTEHAANVAQYIYVVNNLIYNTHRYGINFFNNGGENTINNVYIINNTVLGYQNNSANRNHDVLSIKDQAATADNIVVRNNIFYVASNTNSRVNSTVDIGTYIDSDYNIYYRASSTRLFDTNFGNPNYTLATWQTATSEDANSLQTDPYIITLSDSAPNARLQRIALGQANDSPAIGIGLETPYTPPAFVDTAGVLANDGAVVGSTRSDSVLDTGALDLGYHYYTPTPTGSLASTNVEPATLYVGTTNTVTASFTTANAIPLDGKIVITFPTSLGGGFTFDSGGTSAAAFTVGGSGNLAISRVGSVITLTRSGGSEIAASTAVALTITFVQNPSQVGETGAYEIKTTTSADTSIDIDSNVSADQVIEPASGTYNVTFTGACTFTGTVQIKGI